MAIRRTPTAQQQDARRGRRNGRRPTSFRFGQVPGLNTDPGIVSSASQFAQNRQQAGDRELRRMKGLAKATTFNQLDAMANEVLRPVLTAEGANVQKEWSMAQEHFAENFDKIRERYDQEDFDKDLMPLYERAEANFLATGQTHLARELHKVEKREHTQKVARQQDQTIKNIIKDGVLGADAFVNRLDGNPSARDVNEPGGDLEALIGYADAFGMEGDDKIGDTPDQREALIEKYMSDTLVESIQAMATGDKLQEAEATYKKHKDRIDPSLYPKLDNLFKTMGELDIDNYGLKIARDVFAEPDLKKRRYITEAYIDAAPVDQKGKLARSVNYHLGAFKTEKKEMEREEYRQTVGTIHSTVSKMIQDGRPKEETRQTYQDFLNKNAVTLGNQVMSMRRNFEDMLKDKPKKTNMSYMREVVLAYSENPKRAAKDYNPYDPKVLNSIHGTEHNFIRSLYKGQYDKQLQGMSGDQRRLFWELYTDAELPDEDRIQIQDDLEQLRLQGDAKDPDAMKKLFQRIQTKKTLLDASKPSLFNRLTWSVFESPESEENRRILEEASRDVRLNTPSPFPLSDALKPEAKPHIRAMARTAQMNAIQRVGGRRAMQRLPKSEFIRRWQIEYALLRQRGVTINE